MAGFVLCSHDGFGVGHTRRHVVLARALRAAAPRSPITLVTGLAFTPRWLSESGFRVIRIPPLLKDRTGRYSSPDLDFESALAKRETGFAAVIDEQRPEVVVVDRHPFGTNGELGAGLERAKRLGSRVVLGLRDILDDPDAIRAELASDRWRAVGDVFDEAIVYGLPNLCDHEVEYGIPLPLRYCGWVVEMASPTPREARRLTVTSGGGADGYALFELGIRVAERLQTWRVTIAAGGYVDPARLNELVARSGAASRIETRWRSPGCAQLFAATAATLQMAGYNSTFEALAASRRPILVPRRHPRTEQAIRAERLVALGVADAVTPDDHATVCALLRRPRRLTGEAVHRAGLRFDGAARAAEVLIAHQRGTPLPLRASPRSA